MRLPSLGLQVLSARPDALLSAIPGLRRLDAHLDLVDWRKSRRVLPLAVLCEKLAGLVRARAADPIGLLTHHLVTDGEGIAVLDRLLTAIMKHSKGLMVRAADVVREAR